MRIFSLRTVSVIVFILAGALYAKADDREWDKIIATSGYGATSLWFYETVEPDSYLIAGELGYKGEDVGDLVTITYKDSRTSLQYPYSRDYAFDLSQPVAADKTSVCGASMAVITLRKILKPENPALSKLNVGRFYGYERIFLNLDNDGQATQVFDDYSTKVRGNVPLSEFLEQTKHRCKDGFISFPDSKEN